MGGLSDQRIWNGVRYVMKYKWRAARGGTRKQTTSASIIRVREEEAMWEVESTRDNNQSGMRVSAESGPTKDR